MRHSLDVETGSVIIENIKCKFSHILQQSNQFLVSVRISDERMTDSSLDKRFNYAVHLRASDEFKRIVDVLLRSV